MEFFSNIVQNNARKGLVTLFFIICGLYAVSSERRCYSFTWLGPSFNNQSIFMNATCQDATRLSSGVPCVQPLVVSEDGTWPDVEQIWTEHRQEATCVLNDNDVCAQYTFYFNGVPENSTYMCTRAMDTMGAAIMSGCYAQVVGSASTRVCLCRSFDNGLPCNDAAHHMPSFVIVALSTFLLLFYINYYNSGIK